MPVISAAYDVAMPQWCFVEIATSENFALSVVDGDYTVSMSFQLTEWGKNTTSPDQKTTRGIERVLVKVTRDLPKPVDFGNPLVVFEKNLMFSAAAIKVLNRFIHYFRFTLYTPLLREFTYADGQFAQAVWYDEKDNRIPLGMMNFVLPTHVGKDGHLAAKRFNMEDQEELRVRLVTPLQNTLVEQLLADAQNAWFNKTYFSAVVEMAIACEQGIKGHFKQEDIQDGNPKKKVGMADLLHQAGLKVYARSYKDEHPKEFKAIDYLFRCRNSVAHEATLSFNEDNGNVLTPNHDKIAEWWYISFHLLTWLDSLATIEIKGNPV